MKIKRFFAKTMRAALQKVREEQGPDSVILSNRRIAGGIEVIAAVDYDEALLHQSYPQNSSFSAELEARTTAVNSGTDSASQPITGQARPDPMETVTRHDLNLTQEADPALDPEQPIAIIREPQAYLEETVSDPSLTDMRQELQSLRTMMEHQLTQLTWNDLQRRQPERAAIIGRLTLMGLDRDIIESVLSALPHSPNHRHMWRNALALLAKRIPLTNRDICADGGIYALVGPSGTGKTTSIAKLAARFALKHGADQVALISTDSHRIGAMEQLSRFGKILGVPVQVASNPAALRSTLLQMKSKKLILIDTAGINQRMPKLLQRLATITQASPQIQTLLTIAANTQTEGLKETITAFACLPLRGTIVTKLDETATLGGLFSAVISSAIKICYVTQGQRIPEDIRVAVKLRADLVSRAVMLSKQLNQTQNEQHLQETKRLETDQRQAVVNG